MIKVAGIRKTYGNIHVLKGVDLYVQPAEVVAIVGASGAGKSTLLHIMGLLDKPDAGTLAIAGVEVNWTNQLALAEIRNKKIGFVFQFHNLLPEFTALENVIMPGLISGRNVGELKNEGKMLLEKLGLSGRENHKPSELSGGEQQRTAVARALINKPLLLLADEPSGNLDSKNAKELHDLFFQLRKEFNQTLVIVTHNSELAAMADRKVQMADGLIS
ncbi:MAG: ABC transporter ATP-binding protein [Cyclobacteriaceae bacterium]|jgi:lipoprotein-releasing system ATP-binding protein|nr:ABC transporter ATP-binding protein [Cytophagales bacterium]MCZ8327625.1 ABC transporter ATP-binding protein [Cyclobacteriaceae bacterium]